MLQILEKINAVLPEVKNIRRQLHRMPELAGEERRTSAFIRRCLADIPELEVLPPFLETDVVAILHGEKGPGPNVTLRADIDGLPLTENTGLPFASETPGLMHGCGHDAHSAILIGAAMVLAQCKKDFAGTIRFVWQPGEESRAMAKDLVAAGAIDDPLPVLVAGLHIWPGLKEGEVCTASGACMASSDHFKITIRGQGGHGSRPDLSRNPILALCEAVSALQTAAANRLDPRNSGVISICRINCGDADNVIAASGELAGTIRALDEESRAVLLDAVKTVPRAIASAHRMECDVCFHGGYKVLENDPEETAMAVEAMTDAGLKVSLYNAPHMGSEDFSFYGDKAPLVYLNLGNGVDSGALHAPDFAFSEDVAGNGIKALTAIALNRLMRS